jgi:TonB family protein
MAIRTTFVSEEVEKLSQPVKRFQSLCDMHRIAFGAPGDLEGFLRGLRENRHLAMDFWAMVGELSSRERGTLDDAEMMSAIIEASTGTTFDQLPESERKAAAELQQMIAGVDVEAQSLPTPDTTPAETLSQADIPSLKNTNDIQHARLTIAEALLRLEQTSRELRDQLHAIEDLKAQEEVLREVEEERLEEKVPEKSIREETEEQAVRAPIEAKPPIEPIEPVVEPIVVKAPVEESKILQSRLVDERPLFSPQRSQPPLMHRGFAPSDIDDDPSIAVPLSAYEETQGRNPVVVIAVLVGVAVLAWAMWFALSRGYAQQWISGFVPAAKQKLSLFWGEVHDVTHKEASKPNAATGATAGNVAPTQSSTPSAKPESNPANSPAASKPQQAQPETLPPFSPKEKSVPARAPSSVASSSSVPLPLEPPSAIETHAVHVSAAVMEDNLMASRVAVYPPEAKARGIQGTVVMEALISRYGGVQHVRVLSGDSHLRAAAVEAVLRRRYKPYVQNGRPVDVATQVSVTFRMPRR